MIKIKSSNRKPEQKPIYYVCNRQRCKDCQQECRWTRDPDFALYDEHNDFSPEKDGLYERVRK